MASLLNSIHEFLRYGDIGATLIAALATLVSAGLSGVVAKSAGRFLSKKEILENDLDKVVNTIQASASEARARALEALAEKVPSNVSKEEFKAIVQSGIRIGGDLIINQESLGERELVEDLVTTYHQQALPKRGCNFGLVSWRRQ